MTSKVTISSVRKKKRIQKKLVYHFKAHWEQIEESSLRPTKELFILCLYSFHYFQVAIIIISIEKTWWNFIHSKRLSTKVRHKYRKKIYMNSLYTERKKSLKKKKIMKREYIFKMKVCKWLAYLYEKEMRLM